MNQSSIFETLQQGFRVTVGATATLIETLQDAEKRSNTLTELQKEWETKSHEWAEKGVVTEQSARQFLENLIKKQQGEKTTPKDQVVDVSSTPSPSSPEVQQEIKRLTEQIIALRLELEQAKKQG